VVKKKVHKRTPFFFSFSRGVEGFVWWWSSRLHGRGETLCQHYLKV